MEMMKNFQQISDWQNHNEIIIRKAARLICSNNIVGNKFQIEAVFGVEIYEMAIKKVACSNLIQLYTFLM